MIHLKGIILSRVLYKDSGAILRLLTPQGKLSVLVQGIHRGARSAQAALYVVGNELDWVLYPQKTLSDTLYRVKESSLSGGRAGCSVHPLNQARVMFMCELVGLTTENYVEEKQLYSFLSDSLDALTGKGKGKKDFPCLDFACTLTRYLGIGPLPERRDGDYFDLCNGVCTPFLPAHNYYLKGRHLNLFVCLVSGENLPKGELSAKDYRDLWHILMTYYRLHLPEFKIPRSLELLQSLTVMEL